MKRSMVWLSLIAIAAAAPHDREADDEKAKAALVRQLSGLTAEPAQQCLSSLLTRNADMTSYGDFLLIRATDATRYVTRTNGCRGIGGRGHNIMIMGALSTRLCQGESVALVDNSSHESAGSCAVGNFIPFRKR